VHNKVNRFSMYLLLFIALILQMTIVDYLKISGAKPDLMLILVIFFGLFFGVSAGLESGFAAGLSKDIFSTDIFGINTLTLVVTGLMVGLLSPKFFKESRITQAAIVFALALLSMLVHYITGSIISNVTYMNLPEYIFGLMIPASLYTCAVSAIIFPILINSYDLERREEFL
jgi:rod shape-determining protein MreD